MFLTAAGSLHRDAVYALRTFARNPGFTAAVTLSIALGIAANTTVFSMVNTLLLKTLPVRDPGRLVAFSDGNTFSYPDYLDYKAQTADVFEGLAANFPAVPAGLSGGGEPERVWGQFVTGNYFQVVGVKPVMGRDFLPEEDEAPGRNAVVILSHGLWRRRFASDPAIAGKSVILNNRPYTVVGVAPPGFAGTVRGLVAEFWAPLAMYAELMPDFGKQNMAAERRASWLVINGRLRPATEPRQAAARVNVVKARIDAEHRKEQTVRQAITIDKAGGMLDRGSRKVTGLMTILTVVVGLVLLIACANVANLMLARGAARQREMGIRLAIGAGRGRLVRQLLTESVLLSLAGAAGGLALSHFATAALTRLRLPLPIPIVFDFTPDARVLAFTAALAVLTGMIFGLAPAIRSARTDVVTAVKGGENGGIRRFGLRDGLVVVQVALCLVLLVGAGLFLRSLRNAAAIDTGMRPDNVLAVAVDPKLHGYTSERSRQFLTQLRTRLEALPGVASVSYVDVRALGIGGSSTDYTAANAPAGARPANADIYMVGARYFETVGVPILRGRDFRLAGDAASGVLINATLARTLFGNDNPIGRQIRHQGKSHEVIGLVRDFKSRTLGEKPVGCTFHYLEPDPDRALSLFGITILVKAAGTASPQALLGAVRGEIGALDRHMAVFDIETLRERVEKALLVPKLCATLLTVFGCAGLLLATVGLYGVMSYAVRRRTREIGIRMALGAPAGRVLRTVAGHGMALAGAGAAIGMAAAFALSRFTASLLYGVSTTDTATFVAVPAVLLAVALAAALLPARRAAGVDPNAALRCD